MWTHFTRRLAGWLLVMALAGAGGGVRAEEKWYSERYGPIQKRVYDLDHEISMGWALLPLDAYYKGYGIQIGYTIHFNEIWALELFRLGWSYNLDTKLKNKLIDQIPDVSPSEFPAVVLWENTNLLFKFFYGKQSFLNDTVIHFELFATAGGAFLFRNPYPLWDGDFHNANYEFGVNGGFGARFWITPRWSLRVDLRDTVVLITFNRGKFPLKNVALVGLTFGVNL